DRLPRLRRTVRVQGGLTCHWTATPRTRSGRAATTARSSASWRRTSPRSSSAGKTGTSSTCWASAPARCAGPGSPTGRRSCPRGPCPAAATTRTCNWRWSTAMAADLFATDRSWRRVRTYGPTSEDGHAAVLYVSEMPARFYRVRCDDFGVDFSTGSGDAMRILAQEIAEAIAGGMLNIEASLGARLGFQPIHSRTHGYNRQEHR